ncbi:hypothetical protein GCM10027030_06640 [Luteococcus sediminum]
MRPIPRLTVLCLAITLPLLGACGSNPDPDNPQDPAHPSTIAWRAQQLTRAAGTEEVSTIVSARTSMTARLAKKSRITGWAITQGGSPKAIDVASYTPVATLPLGRLDMASQQELASRACNGVSRMVTTVVATGHAVTSVQCGDDTQVRAVLVDGKQLPPSPDRFSPEGIAWALEAARTVAPQGGPLALNLGPEDTVSLIVPTIAAGGTRCHQPTVTVPVPGHELGQVAPETCRTAKDPRADRFYSARGSVDLSQLDPGRVSRALGLAAQKANSSLEECSAAQVRASKGGAEAVVSCPAGGGRTYAVEPID